MSSASDLNQKLGVRTTLHSEAREKLVTLVSAFHHLKELCPKSYYPHLSFERREKNQIAINPKGTQFDQKIESGVMLRIFTGETLFEVCGDSFDLEELKKKNQELIELVRRPTDPSMTYKASTWSERLARSLDPEISTQIPKNPDSETWVHFGSLESDPLWTSLEEKKKHAQSVYDELKSSAAQLPENHLGKDPDFLNVRMGFENLSFVFIDEEVRMTQALARNHCAMVAVKSGDRGLAMKGGLGGKETVTPEPELYKRVFEEIAMLQGANRLKAGSYDVIMSPSITGVFAHEAFGHTQEGDTWARGRSKAAELFHSGAEVGNKKATIINNPASYENAHEKFAAWGSYFFDEEGWLAEKTELVKEGKLCAPMTNLSSSARLGVPRTANGKREAWTNGTYTRQTNTYFSEGSETFDELLKKVEYGFLASTCFGGMEDPKGMGIQVGIGFVEEIKDGKLTGQTFKAPNGGALQMTGYVPDLLNRIDGKTKIDAFSNEPDQSQNPWNEVGGCGKYHKEFVVAGCGGPYMLVRSVHLG